MANKPKLSDTVTLSADEYYLDSDMFDGNDEQIDGLHDRLEAYRAATARLLEVWEHGDLAAAVRDLAALFNESVEVATSDIADWKLAEMGLG